MQQSLGRLPETPESCACPAALLQPDYDPNTRHAIYGQDADLILLGLLRCAQAGIVRARTPVAWKCKLWLLHGQHGGPVGLCPPASARASSPAPPPIRSHEPHFCILREAGTLEAVLEGARDAGDEGAPDMWSPVGGWAAEAWGYGRHWRWPAAGRGKQLGSCVRFQHATRQSATSRAG